MRISRIIAALVLLLACGGVRGNAQSVAPQPDSVTPAGSGNGGLIQPGDQIVLAIWREPDLSGTFSVDATGVVVLPRVGAVHAASRTGPALQAELRESFARYLRNPSIEIQVLRRVGVQGEVQRPGLYMIDLTKTLRDVISEAGGITEFGNPNRISIVRGGQRIRLGSGERARYLAAELQSGDQVVVGRRSWFELNSLAIVSTAAVVVSVVVPLLRSAF